MSIRTDLISEIQEMHTEKLSGAVSKESEYKGITVAEVEIIDAAAAAALEKPIGRYITLRFDRPENMADTKPLEEIIAKAVSSMLTDKVENVMIAGLGNADITPDALGPMVADKILVTRHIKGQLSRILGVERMSAVSAIATGVIGKTGVEAAEMVSAACERIKPDAVIAIDALAARRPERLCTTVQISDTGITPGSGVHNARKSLDFQSLGVPVIAIGMPTVIEAATYSFDHSGISSDEKMMVTPKDIDMQIKVGADIISTALNTALHPEIEPDIIRALML